MSTAKNIVARMPLIMIKHLPMAFQSNRIRNHVHILSAHISQKTIFSNNHNLAFQRNLNDERSEDRWTFPLH